MQVAQEAANRIGTQNPEGGAAQQAVARSEGRHGAGC
jgi:hypothetical protein